jgi:hypothetical protein
MLNDEPDDWPIQQVQTQAAQCRHPTSIVTSVFDLAHTPFRLRSEAKAKVSRKHHRIERLGDVTRHTRILEQDTNEWKEQEIRRRAKQIVPRPPKKARTMSKRFAVMVGVSA